MSRSTAPTASSGQASRYTYRGKPADPRHLEIALQHANQIQAQKDAQALILDRILELVDFPSSDSADPARPSAKDAAALKQALFPFQPTDYDNLILERNIEGHCGYALCPREHRKEDPKAKFRIVWGPKGSGENGRGREMKVVPREMLEMWCSDQCAERALYLRVQLAEEPVWGRRAGGDEKRKHFVLLEEAQHLKQAAKETERATLGNLEERSDVARVDQTLSEEMATLKINKDSPAISDKGKQLALERGGSGPILEKQGRVDVHIREKDLDFDGSVPAAPIAQPGDSTGGSIEGYVSKGIEDRLKRTHNHDDAPEETDVLNNI